MSARYDFEFSTHSFLSCIRSVLSLWYSENFMLSYVVILTFRASSFGINNIFSYIRCWTNLINWHSERFLSCDLEVYSPGLNSYILKKGCLFAWLSRCSGLLSYHNHVETYSENSLSSTGPRYSITLWAMDVINTLPLWGA